MSRPAAREAALSALVFLEKGGRFDGALRECDRRAGSDARELRLARRIVRGVTKGRGRLDWILARVLRKGNPEQLDTWTRNALRIGLFQIVYLSSIPSHAAVGETVRLARSRGGQRAAGLVNAVLRTVIREGLPGGLPSLEDDPAGHLAVEESFPLWLVERWIRRVGVDRTAKRIRAANGTPPLSIRVLRPDDVEPCFLELQDAGLLPVKSCLHPSVLTLEGGTDPLSLAPFREGRMMVQDEAAAVIGLLAQPLDEVRSLLDICSAPGGKLISLAASGPSAMRAISADISPARLRRVKENLDRVGPLPVDLVAADGLALPFDAKFDLVLLDVPCTGLGTTARHADLRWRVTEKDISRLAQLSSRLLQSSADRVEVGGVLLYSTCTTEPEENEEVIARFLEKDSRFHLEPPGVSLAGDLVAKDGTVTIVPELHGCDGAFGARLRRVGR